MNAAAPTPLGTVVVGVGPGIGASVARAFSAAGHPVALVARDASRLAGLVTSIEASGGRALAITGDASDPRTLAAAVLVADLAAPVVCLVHNVAAVGGPLTTTDLATLRRAADVNVHSLVAVTTALMPALRLAGGSVLVTGGELALHPAAAAGVLSVGKAGLRAAALVLAQELEPLGVAVATVTIAGAVEAGGPFDPERIAQVYLRLHQREVAGPEVVFTAQGPTGAPAGR